MEIAASIDKLTDEIAVQSAALAATHKAESGNKVGHGRLNDEQKDDCLRCVLEVNKHMTHEQLLHEINGSPAMSASEVVAIEGLSEKSAASSETFMDTIIVCESQRFLSLCFVYGLHRR